MKLWQMSLGVLCLSALGCASAPKADLSAERTPASDSADVMTCIIRSDSGAKDFEISTKAVKANWSDLGGGEVYPARYLSGPRFDPSRKMAYFFHVLAENNFPVPQCHEGYCATGTQGYAKLHSKAVMTPEASGPFVCIQVRKQE